MQTSSCASILLITKTPVLKKDQLLSYIGGRKPISYLVDNYTRTSIVCQGYNAFKMYIKFQLSILFQCPPLDFILT